MTSSSEEAARIAQLEKRVADLETLVADMRKDILALVSQNTYLHYLKRFQEKISTFAAYGITLTIDQEAQEVIYQNGRNTPIRYPINQVGYNRALRALNNVKTRHRKQAKINQQN